MIHLLDATWSLAVRILVEFKLNVTPEAGRLSADAPEVSLVIPTLGAVLILALKTLVVRWILLVLNP